MWMKRIIDRLGFTSIFSFRKHLMSFKFSATMAVGLSFIASMTTGPLSHAQERATLDPQKADADFAIQGEYVGDIVRDGLTVKLGIQLVAQGSSRFLGIGYFGGLPGDGWNGVEPVKSEGAYKNGTLELTPEADVSVKDGVITIRDNAGGLIGECKKVERKSPTLGEKPPADAVVLFDGKSADRFEGGKLDGDFLVQGVTSKQKFQNYSLHLEFQLAYMPNERGQGRANSGCYSQGRYEVQILDSFGLSGQDNECGGIYGIRKPDVNMCFPPLAWQTYDIDFTAAKYADGKKIADARMTVKHNGVLIHDNVAVPKATTAAPVAEGPEPGPIYLQDHGNPVRFRNIWLTEKK
jgi:hypothetical protein